MENIIKILKKNLLNFLTINFYNNKWFITILKNNLI